MDEDTSLQSDTVALLAILLVVAIAILIFYLSRRRPAPTPAALVPLGTNSPVVGAAFYDPVSRELRGTLVKVDNAYEFADGTIRPSVLVKAKSGGAEGWVPLDNMRKVLVESLQ